MQYNIEVQIANTESKLQSIYEVRREVFVKEQKVSEREEYDEYETSSTHLAAIYNDEIVGTCRFRNTDKGVKLERFAVLKTHRDKGVGGALVQAVLKHIDTDQNVYLHAQIQVVGFYEKFSFYKVGEEFVEANIRHYKMVYKS
ncbi:MAG: GNAT family N-acetyltransferase [Bacteroidia bacterium]